MAARRYEISLILIVKFQFTVSPISAPVLEQLVTLD